jgi:hypothetical protein
LSSAAEMRKTQGDVRHDVKQKNAYFIESDQNVIERVELFNREAKPSRVKTVYEIVRVNERDKPYNQQCVIYDRAPEQKIPRHFYIHDPISFVKTV